MTPLKSSSSRGNKRLDLLHQHLLCNEDLEAVEDEEVGGDVKEPPVGVLAVLLEASLCLS